MKEIYKFIENISNSVGKTITEYHWKECLGLMKYMEDENIIEKPNYKIENEDVSETNNDW